MVALSGRLPDDSRDYMLEFIQNFTENKTMNGYAHVSTTTDPRLPAPEMQQQSFARPSHDGYAAGSARYEYSEGARHHISSAESAPVPFSRMIKAIYTFQLL